MAGRAHHRKETIFVEDGRIENINFWHGHMLLVISHISCFGIDLRPMQT